MRPYWPTVNQIRKTCFYHFKSQEFIFSQLFFFRNFTEDFLIIFRFFIFISIFQFLYFCVFFYENVLILKLFVMIKKRIALCQVKFHYKAYKIPNKFSYEILRCYFSIFNFCNNFLKDLFKSKNWQQFYEV